MSQGTHRRIRLSPALVVAFALVAAGPAASLAAAPRDRSTPPGQSSPAEAPQSTDGTTASTSPGKATGNDKGTSEPGASNGKAQGHNTPADRGPVGNGHGKAKGHDKRPGPAPVDRPGTANPDPGGRDNPGKGPGKGPSKGPDQGADPKDSDGGRKTPRAKDAKTTGGATTQRSGSASVSSGTGVPAPAPVPVRVNLSSTADPTHTRAAAAPSRLDSRPSLATQLFAAGTEGSEATKRFAFPLLLTVIVVLFLMLQGRFDRKDDKLSLAPVDYSEGLLTFE